MITFFRAIKFGLQNAWRNFGLSTITVTILVVMLLSVNLIFAMSAVTNAAISSVKDQVDVTIFFSPDAKSDRVEEIQKTLTSFPEVKETILKTPEQVLAEFKERHLDSEAIQYSLKELGNNPLGATLIVRTFEPGQYKAVLSAIKIPEYEGAIESRTFDDTGDIISRIDMITNRAENIAWGITLVFGIIAFMIVASSIRVAIFTQREEIGIQKLVGAGNWFIRAPFFVEVVLYSSLAMAISLVLLYFGTTLSDPYVRTLFGSYDFSVYRYFMDRALWLFTAEFGALVTLCIMSGFIAMRRFLRV